MKTTGIFDAANRWAVRVLMAGVGGNALARQFSGSDDPVALAVLLWLVGAAMGFAAVDRAIRSYKPKP